MKRPSGLQAQVLIAGLGLAGVLLLALLVLLMQDRRNRRDLIDISRESQSTLVAELARSHAQAIATQLAEALVNDLYYLDLASIGGQLAFVRQMPLVADAMVFDADGEILHDGSREISGYGTALHQPLVRSALADEQTHVHQHDSLLEAARAIRIGDQVLGGVLVRFELGRLDPALVQGEQHLVRRLDQAAQARIQGLIALVAALVALGFAAAWMFQRRVVRPVLRLAGAVQRMEAGDYESIHLDRGRRDELGALERAFERMSQRVAETYRTTSRDAHLDALTGLPNRRAFDQALAARLARAPTDGKPFALMFIDADDFKQINDRHGHEAGDAALFGFARRAQRALAQAAPGAWLARIGGDEFAVICDGDPPADEALRVANAIAAEPDRAPPGRGSPPLGVSIGIAVCPAHATTAGELLRCADRAMYEAKRAGKGAVRVFDATGAA
jgi:diguanylate cyclase (GGDEF)-like protein